MGKSLFIITAAIVILSAGSLISDAQAGSSAPGEGTRMRHKPAHAPARAKPTQSAPHAINPAPTSASPTSWGNGTCSPLPRFGKVEQARRLAEGGLPWCGGGGYQGE